MSRAFMHARSSPLRCRHSACRQTSRVDQFSPLRLPSPHSERTRSIAAAANASRHTPATLFHAPQCSFSQLRSYATPAACSARRQAASASSEPSADAERLAARVHAPSASCSACSSVAPPSCVSSARAARQYAQRDWRRALRCALEAAPCWRRATRCCTSGASTVEAVDAMMDTI